MKKFKYANKGKAYYFVVHSGPYGSFDRKSMDHDNFKILYQNCINNHHKVSPLYKVRLDHFKAKDIETWMNREES